MDSGIASIKKLGFDLKAVPARRKTGIPLLLLSTSTFLTEINVYNKPAMSYT